MQLGPIRYGRNSFLWLPVHLRWRTRGGDWRRLIKQSHGRLLIPTWQVASLIRCNVDVAFFLDEWTFNLSSSVNFHWWGEGRGSRFTPVGTGGVQLNIGIKKWWILCWCVLHGGADTHFQLDLLEGDYRCCREGKCLAPPQRPAHKSRGRLGCKTHIHQRGKKKANGINTWTCSVYRK